MSKVSAGFTMSLDGFIAGPNDEVDLLFRWYSSGDADFPVSVAGTDRVFKISRASAELLKAEWSELGAIVTGRRDFDVSGAWAGQPPLSVPTFIVTHSTQSVDPKWLAPGSPFTFVTDGVPSAIDRAKEAAAGKGVGVGGSTIVQQCLKAGLLDEIQIELVPVLLGAGIRLFDNLGPEPIELETIKVVAAPDVTHLRYRVVKRGD